jgi:molybdopterin-guanine dinucleotide biosynthesis protein A
METMDHEHLAVTHSWSLILLTGGRGSRLGTDKSNVVVGTRTTAQRILDELPAEVPVTVVGAIPDRLNRDVTVTRETPVGGGPAAGVAAGLVFTHTEFVAVLATDMPFAAPVLVELFAALDAEVDGVLALDSSGRHQYLCAIYRTSALRAALAGDTNNVAMHSVLAGLNFRTVSMDERVWDIDTPEDLERARDRAGVPEMKEN